MNKYAKIKLVKDFYLICEDIFSCNGLALTNLDKPTIIVFIQDLEQFTKTFIHELKHLEQHSKNYTNEKEAKQSERELIIE